MFNPVKSASEPGKVPIKIGSDLTEPATTETSPAAIDLSALNLHIMHVTDSLSIGGKERMLVEIANATAAAGHKVSVCVTRQGTDLAKDLQQDIPVYVLHRQNRFDLSAMRKLARLITEQQIDILHVHGRASFSFLAFMKQIGLCKTPILLHDHFGKIELDDSTPVWFRLWGRRWISRYVGVCAKLGEWAIASGVPKGNVSIIENALDLQKIQTAATHNIRQELEIESDCLLGIIVGNVRPEKGVDTLIDAVAQSSSRHLIRIIIVGKDVDKAYAEACRNRNVLLKMEDTVTFLGSQSDIPGLLKGVDFAVMPSRSESGPLVLIEFMASGLPFVATNVGGISHRALELGVSAFVPPDSAADLSRAIDELVSLPRNERLARGQIGQQIALANFNLAQMMPRWYELYAGMVKKSSR